MALVNSFGSISQKAGFKGEKELLAHALPVETIGKFGKPCELPKNSGDKVKWQRAVSLAPLTVPLAEGIAPAGSPFAYEDVEAVVDQWGDFIPTTDKITDLHENPVGKDMAAVLGEQAGLTYEMIMWAELTSGTSVFYANGAANRAAVISPPLKADLQRITTLLNRNKAKHITSVMTSDQKFDSKSVEPGYVALVHTDAKSALRELSGFKHVSDYGKRETVSEYEFGSFEELRIVCSPELNAIADAGALKASTGMRSTTGTNVDVYQMAIFGKDAWGKIEMRANKKSGGPIKPIVSDPSNAGVGNELGQKGSIGWKGWFSCKLLNELWITRYEFALTE